jgi:hypothetical protein
MRIDDEPPASHQWLHAFTSCSILLAAFNIILWPVEVDDSKEAAPNPPVASPAWGTRRLSEYDLQERQAALLKGVSCR